MFRQFVGNQVNLTEQALPEHPEIGLFFYITRKAAKLINDFFPKISTVCSVNSSERNDIFHWLHPHLFHLVTMQSLHTLKPTECAHSSENLQSQSLWTSWSCYESQFFLLILPTEMCSPGAYQASNQQTGRTVYCEKHLNAEINCRNYTAVLQRQ